SVAPFGPPPVRAIVDTDEPSQSETHWPRIWTNAIRRGPTQTGPSGKPSPVASTRGSMGLASSAASVVETIFIVGRHPWGATRWERLRGTGCESVSQTSLRIQVECPSLESVRCREERNKQLNDGRLGHAMRPSQRGGRTARPYRSGPRANRGRVGPVPERV